MAAERTLLSPGHPAWERLGAQKQALRRRPAQTPIEELLRAGQRLSAQAAALRRAVVRGRKPAGP